MDETRYIVPAFLIGAVFGIIVCVLMIKTTDNACSRNIRAIEACEAELPRNQHCTVVGVLSRAD